jgi:hypothetical protein
VTKHRYGKRRLSYRQLQTKYASARADLRKLRSKGVISVRANLKRPKPSSALLKKLENFRPILEGHAQVVKLPRAETRKFREAGFDYSNGRIIIATEPTQRLRVEGGQVVIKEQGYRSVFKKIIPPVRRDFATFHRYYTEHPGELEAMVPKGSMLGFTYFGNKSRVVGNVEDILEWLSHYDTLTGQDGTTNAKDARNNFKQLILYAMDARQAKFWEGSPRTKYKRRSTHTVQDRRQASGRGPRKAIKKTHAQAQRDYIASLRSTPKRDFEYRSADAERKRLSRARQKDRKNET